MLCIMTFFLCMDIVLSDETPIRFRIHVHPDDVEGKDDINTSGGIQTRTVYNMRLRERDTLYIRLSNVLNLKPTFSFIPFLQNIWC